MVTPGRLTTPDALRGLAMVAMTSTHALRILTPHPPPAVADLLFDLEPLTATLFFGLLGWGAAHGRATSADPSSWARRQWRRALILAGLSLGLHTLQNGLQWPASLTGTGVLLTLGVSLALLSFLAGRPGRLAAATAVVVTIWLALDSTGFRLAGLNRGSFPVFPWVPVALLGAAACTWGPRFAHLRRPGILLACLVTVAMPLMAGPRVFLDHWGTAITSMDLRTPPGGLRHGPHQIMVLLGGTPMETRTMHYWQIRPRLLPWLVAVLALLTAGFGVLAHRSRRLLAPLAALGRVALPYYLAHLAVLTACLALPSGWRHATWSFAVATLVLTALGILASTRRRPASESI